MNKQIFNQDEALFAAFEEAKQARNFLLAEQLAQKIYQKYPSRIKIVLQVSSFSVKLTTLMPKIIFPIV